MDFIRHFKTTYWLYLRQPVLWMWVGFIATVIGYPVLMGEQDFEPAFSMWVAGWIFLFQPILIAIDTQSS